MQLEFAQIQAITVGAARVEAHKDGIHFYRFTKGQERLYQARSADFHVKTFSTSGIRLRFRTDSRVLGLRGKVLPGCSRSYFSFDIFVNGKMVDTVDNFTGLRLPHDYTKMDFPLGTFEKTVTLGEGEKEVCIYLPWSVQVVLQTLSLDEGAFVTPAKPAKKILCFGDSITHGYDALRPSNKYISKLADVLDAEEYNKAIGGEIFWPELAATREDFEPDWITVAYGTNDWNTCSRTEFENNCKAFYRNLHETYPRTPIFAITPIWRQELEEERPFGPFLQVGEHIRALTADLEHVTVVDGFDFVPQNAQYYADLRLHPDDQGFAAYYGAIWSKIKGELANYCN
ncbi:MAG: SGNH/GDSL hydrolase family protein [Clostridia bacterium]|nr:SGNH/GDSL hydrolase family protein [Clostridia bacterium]